MTKGRRAADRRRERARSEGSADGYVDDDTPGTTPGPTVSPHDDYVEVDDDPSRLLVSAVMSEEVESAPSARLPQPRAAPRPSDDDVGDAEKNFAREWKQRPREDTAVNAGLEITEVKERKARRRRRGGRLVVVGVDGVAPPAPVEVAIVEHPALLGRDRAAALRFDDPTISLRHAELAWDDDDDDDDSPFSIVDLGSTSGTLVNGVVIDGRTTLRHGDVVALGKTELRFLRGERPPAARPEPVIEPAGEPVVEPVAVEPPPPERTSTQVRVARQAEADAQRLAQRLAEERARAQLAERRQRVRRRAGFVIAACAALAVVGVTGRFAYGALLSDAAPAQVRVHVATLLAEARERLLRGDVDEATARVGALLALDPGNEEGQSLERVVRTERDARDAVQLALRLGDEDRDDEALDALARVADASVFARDRDRLKQQLADRALVRSLRIVEGLLEQGRIDDALARVEAHLKRFPEDKGGQQLLLRVQNAKTNAPGDPALASARAAFAEGRVDDARRIASAAGFPGYVRDLDRFAKAMSDGKGALARYDGAAARAPLDDAFRLLGSLGAGSSSTIFASVQKPYADALYLSGTEKLEQGDGCSAARDLFKAARVLPADRRLQGALQELAARADQGLVRARGTRLEDPERARRIAREALCFARSGTKTWDELSALAR